MDQEAEDTDSPMNAKEVIPMMGSIAMGYARNLSRKNPETQREKLMRARKEFEANIAAIDEALAVLDRNPGVEEAIVALHRVGMI